MSRADATGVWARVLWWTYAIAGSLYLVSRGTSGQGSQVSATLLTAVAVVASAAPLVWLASRLGGLLRRESRWFWGIAYGLTVVATSVGAGVSWLAGVSLGLSPSFGVDAALDVVIVGPIWIGLIGAGVSVWQWSRWRRARIRMIAADIESLRRTEGDTARVIAQFVDSEVRASVSRIEPPMVADSPGRSDEWRVIAQELRELSERVVRPLSHELTKPAGEGRRRMVSPVGWVRQIITQEDFRPLLVAAVFTAGAVSPHVRDYGWWRGLVLLIAEVVTIFVVMGGANALMRRVRQRAWIFLGTVALLQVIPLLPWPQLLGETAMPTAGERIAAIIASVLLILITSGIGLVAQRSRQSLDLLEATVLIAEQQSGSDAVRLSGALRELATTLHGTVQADLISTSLAIESAVADQRWADARQALERIVSLRDQGILGGRGDAGQRPGGLDLRESLALVCLPWQAVGVVEVSIDESIDERQVPAACVPMLAIVRVVEEALTNAFRHGLAHRVEVTVTVAEDRALVRVTDDGLGVPGLTEDSWGMGLASIDDLTAGRWTLSSGAGRTRFEAVISCAL